MSNDETPRDEGKPQYIPDELTRVIASNVRAEMGRARKRQGETARHLGISQQALSRRLLGSYPFSTDQLGKLARFLDVPPANFITGTATVGATA